MLQLDQSGFLGFACLREVGGVQKQRLGFLRFGDFDLDSLGGDFNGKEDAVKGLIVLEQFLRDESLVDVNSGLVEIDEGHEEFHDFLNIEPVALVFGN